MAATVFFLFVFFAVFTTVIIRTVTVSAPLRVLMLVALPHPLFLHEIHRLAAGVVAGTVLAPVLLMARRHVKVDRLALHQHRGRCNDHRLRVDEHRLRVVANVDTAINPRLIDSN